MRQATDAPIRAFLVDLDGVIRQWDADDAPIERAHGLPPGALRNAAFSPSLLNPAITGAINDETWRARIAETLSSHRGAASARAAVQAWSSGCGRIDPEVVRLLQQCAVAVTGLVTNATSRLGRDLRDLGIDSLFTFVLNSSEAGVAKPDRRIFELALSLAGVEAHEALLIDDSVANVEAARGVGLRAHRFVDAGRLASFLKEQGVLSGEGAGA